MFGSHLKKMTLSSQFLKAHTVVPVFLAVVFAAAIFFGWQSYRYLVPKTVIEPGNNSVVVVINPESRAAKAAAKYFASAVEKATGTEVRIAAEEEPGRKKIVLALLRLLRTGGCRKIAD